MRLSKYFTLFAGVALILMLPLILFTYIGTTVSEINREMKTRMAAASVGAMKDIYLKDGYAFRTDEQKTHVLNNFYGALSASFGAIGENSTIQDVEAYIPCVIMADKDGVYVCYDHEYNTWRAERSAYYISPIRTYSASYVYGSNEYFVRFYTDGASLIYKNGLYLASGMRDTINKILSDEDASTLQFYASDQMYQKEADAVIKNTIIRAAKEKLSEANHRKRFDITLSQQIQGPCLFAFFTGKTITLGDTWLVQSAAAGATYTLDEKYVVTRSGGHLMYHRTNCPNISPDDIEAPITMEKAALLGADPCPFCVLSNTGTD